MWNWRNYLKNKSDTNIKLKKLRKKKKIRSNLMLKPENGNKSIAFYVICFIIREIVYKKFIRACHS